MKQPNCMLTLCHRIRSRLIFPYRKLFLTVHWSVRVITNWSVNCQEQFSRNHGRISWTEQTWSRIALPNFTKTVNLNLEKPHFQKHNRKTNPERNRMFAAERYTGTSRKQILWKINSALYSKQLGEHSCSSVLHWILDEATEMHAQKHNRKTNPERNRMIAAERCTGTRPKQILWKINSAHRIRSMLIFSYRKLYMIVHWSVPYHNGRISCTEQT